MKRFVPIALAAAALTTAALAKDANSDFKKFLVQFFPKLEKAFAKMDAAFFDKVTTPDFTETMMGQTMTKQQSLANMKQQSQMMESCKAKFKLLSAKVVNGKGIAASKGSFVMVMKPMSQGAAKQTMTIDMQTQETWVRSGGTWKLQRLVEVGKSKMTMNGKPFDPTKMAPPPGGGTR